MGAKVKKSGLPIDPTLVKLIKEEFAVTMTTTNREEFKRAILDLISKGISPVKGQRRFQPYSESYLAAIKAGRVPGKSPRPVNLEVSGQMLSTLEIRKVRDVTEIKFDDPIADFHNRQGAGASKVIRRLLPTNPGEVFTKVIDDKVKAGLKFAIERLKKKN